MNAVVTDCPARRGQFRSRAGTPHVEPIFGTSQDGVAPVEILPVVVRA